MENLLKWESQAWVLEFLLIKENDETSCELESLENQIKMAISNVTAIPLKRCSIHGAYFDFTAARA